MPAPWLACPLCLCAPQSSPVTKQKPHESRQLISLENEQQVFNVTTYDYQLNVADNPQGKVLAKSLMSGCWLPGRRKWHHLGSSCVSDMKGNWQ